MDSAVRLEGRASDTELWECHSCGVRTLTTERNLWCSGTAGLRTKLMTLRICPRCYRLHPHLVMATTLYRLLHGHIMPQLEEWLAKETEPTFDMAQHVLRVNGASPAAAEPPVEPYKPARIIVPIGV